MRSRDADPVLREHERLAPDYDRRWAAYVQASVGETLARLELGGGERLLDVGCGTGVLLEAAAGAAPRARLVGADPSPQMLGVAHGRLGGSAALVCAYAEALPFADASFDAIVSSSALHFFREPLRAMTEAARVLRGGGRLVLTDWCADYLTCRALDVWLRLTDAAHGRTYGTRACRRLLEQAGFADVRIERYRIDWFWGLMTARAVRPARP